MVFQATVSALKRSGLMPAVAGPYGGIAAMAQRLRARGGMLREAVGCLQPMLDPSENIQLRARWRYAICCAPSASSSIWSAPTTVAVRWHCWRNACRAGCKRPADAALASAQRSTHNPAMFSGFPRFRAMRCVVVLIAATASVHAAAPVADIEVLALFRDQAVIRVDDRRHRLQPGQRSPEGVRLVRTDAGGAVLEIDGRERRYALGSRVQSSYARSTAEQVQIFRDGDGMFTTVGSINGMPVEFLVDTGATSVAMNSAQARRLGIDFRVTGEPGAAVTASRVERVYHVTLDTVKVGGILLRNVEAAVLDGPQPQRTLLGMSFLGRLEMDNDGQRLLLRRKY